MDVIETANNITRSGYSLGLNLPDEYVDRIVDYCKDKGFTRFHDPPKDCEFVSNIAHDPKLVEIARSYWASSPLLWNVNLLVIAQC